MLDIDFIRENKEQVEKAIKVKEIDIDLDRLLTLDETRRKLISQGDELRQRSNQVADEVPKANPQEKKKLIEEGRGVKAQIQQIDADLAEVRAEYDGLMRLVPNLPAEDVPVGGEEDYKVIEEWGQKPKFDFDVQDHLALGEALDILDSERGVKVSGSRGYFLKNQGALMHLGALMLAYKKMIEKGFIPMIPPAMVREFALFGSGHFPFGREEIYELEEYSQEKEKETKFLAGTAEPSLLAYYAGETLDEKSLPVKVVGISPSYRREVGGYGTDTRGVYRVHEFTKVEQIVICKNDLKESEKYFIQMLEAAKELLEELELPYRVIEIATADMGAGKYRMYDIECWMPGRGDYGETHSNSNLTDWQARRLNLKYRSSSGETRYAYTLNNTVIASPRILIALLENHQQKDGSVRVPEALRGFVGTDLIKAGA